MLNLENIKNILPLILLLFVLNSCDKKASHLNVAQLFGDNMVLQQNQKISVWGTALPNTKIKVSINSTISETKANKEGKWITYLAKQTIGKPTKLIIKAHDTIIEYSNILIGEVWLASGQSNMHLDMNRTLNGKKNAKNANNPNIRIYNMRPTYPTGKDGIHTQSELKKLNNNAYFNIEPWQAVKDNNIQYFSAVAYYFAEKLQQDLNVPIGIIHNAVPGSPTESWISKNSLLHHKVWSKLVTTNWRDNEKNGVGKILLDIAKKQVSLSKDSLQKHPWIPTYNYVNGIEPIVPFSIKGIIWYQGESNAENIPMHEELFTTMIANWRTAWHQTELPFYYVQLTSREERPTWPAFRNSQRLLLDAIPNSGMVVISDIGDRKNTHAKQKKPVGERLAILAEGKTYHQLTHYESPLFDTMKIVDNIATITFKGATNGLKTKNKKAVIGFEIGVDSAFITIPAFIKGNTIEINIPKKYQENPKIRYAWKPYSEANLYNFIDLPVSTFKTYR